MVRVPQKERKTKYSGVKYDYVIDKRTGQPVVLQTEHPRMGVVDPSSVFYDAQDHKGHIVCPDCEVADMIHIDAYRQGGQNISVRNHFKIAHGSHHASGCISDLRMDVASDPKPDNKDYSKGPAIFLNALRPVYHKTFNRSARGGANDKTSLVIRDEEGKITLTNPDLADRERFSAKTPSDIFRMMKKLSSERLTSSYIIHGDTSTPWRSFMIRLGNTQGYAQDKKPDFTRFINLARDLETGQRHPVMLHFEKKFTSTFREKDHCGKPVLQTTLPAFTMPHPEDDKKVMRVVPLVVFHDQAQFQDVRKADEMFALSNPVLRPPRGERDPYFMIFDVYEAKHADVASIRDIARSVGSRASAVGHSAPAPA